VPAQLVGGGTEVVPVDQAVGDCSVSMAFRVESHMGVGGGDEAISGMRLLDIAQPQERVYRERGVADPGVPASAERDLDAYRPEKGGIS
jgi:hypothetical protein